jgi:RNA polymerase sigma-70 factor (ECF subfamily)
MSDEMSIEFNEVDEAIRCIREGDKNSFAIVIQAYHVQIRAMIGAQLADKDNADDIAQQTFVFAFQNIDQYKIGTNCLAWLKAIARNKVMTHIRKCSQKNKHLQSFRQQEILNRSTELVNQEEFERRLQTLGDCVEELPEKQRDFLKEVNGRDATLEELAEAMGRTGSAVRKQASRLYASLRDCISKKLKAQDNV